MLKDKRIWTIPNGLSCLRLILLIPIIHALSRTARIEAIIWMFLSLITDSLDGYIARHFNQKSDLGRIVDPLVDKISVLTIVAVLIFHPSYSFPLWYFIFITVRELSILIFGLVVIHRKNLVIESNRAGKISAFANGAAVALFTLNLNLWSRIMLWIAFVLTLYSSWIYIRLFFEKTKN